MDQGKEHIGPNVKRLISVRMSHLAIPSGTKDPLMAGVRAILEKGKYKDIAKKAIQWVQSAIAVVKTAPDNPYGNDDEAIAGELLRRLEEKEKKG